jgi:hypothetical protein
MIVGGETKVKKVKAAGTTPRVLTITATKATARIKERGQAKVTKVDRKERGKPIGLLSAIEPPTPVATATNLDTKIGIAGNGYTMKNKRQQPKPTIANT